MAEYLAPGVYVEEIDTGSKPIEGVSTSTAGMIGVTERGPVNVPILITSVGEFRRWFGELLDVAEFSNAYGPHCYLPHAVEGFFTNGGQRLYVTRILRDDAARAHFELRNRGAAGGFASVLLRPAAQDTGTSVDMPLISVLDGTGLAAGDTLRIGDGSRAEYREVVATADTRHVPVAFPTLNAHDAASTIRKFDYGADGTYTAAFTLSAAVESGATQITVTEGFAGEAATLVTAGAGTLLEVGTGAHAEYRFVTAATAPSAAEATLTLDGELVQDFAAADPVTVVVVDYGVTVDTTLIAAAPAGSTVLFGDDLQSSFDSDSYLLHIEPGTTLAEVVRIGALHELELSGGAYDAYPAGSMVEHVQASDDDRTVNGTAGTSTLTVTSGGIDGLDPGQAVTLDEGGANEEDCVVQSVTAPDTINLTANLTNAHAGSSLTVAAKELTADVEAGAVTLALDSRLGLSDDDVLHIGTAPDDEYVTVSDLMGDTNPGLDAGTVVLTAPVCLDHTAGSEVRRQQVALAAASGTAQHPAFLALDVAEGDDEAYVSDDDAFTNTDLVRVTTASGLSFYHVLEDSADPVTPAEVEVDFALDQNHEAGAPMVERESLIEVEALDAGSWGNRLRVAVEDEKRGLVYRAFLTAAYPLTNEIEISSQTGVEPGAVFELYGPDQDDPAIGPFLKVVRVNRATGRITLSAHLTPAQDTARLAAIAGGEQLRVRSREFRLTVELLRRPDPVTPSRGEQVLATEVFDHLSMDPRHSRYFMSVVGNADVEADESNLRLVDRRTEGNSEFIRTRDLETVQANQEAVRLGPEALVDEHSNGREVAARFRLFEGTDSLLLLDDDVYVGDDADDPLDRTGLQTLRNQDDISIVSCPGRTGSVIQGALISHCEEMRYRFAVLDGPASPNDSIADVQTQRQLFDTKYAALYHPWLQVRHPYPPVPSPTVMPYQIPPSGHVVGVYARTDIERGVHKAPANEVVRGIFGLQQSLNKREHDILNPFPININVIRDFRRENRGIRVYGGRVITSDPDWKYVNVRRLLIFLEKSIERGLQWVVFEPNAEPLWARVVRSISNFLTIVWRNGALEGTSVEEAFFVKCDRTTMTQTDIDNGRLICVIGVAPVKPAEFVIIRIGLWTAYAED